MKNHRFTQKCVRICLGIIWNHEIHMDRSLMIQKTRLKCLVLFLTLYTLFTGLWIVNYAKISHFSCVCPPKYTYKKGYKGFEKVPKFSHVFFRSKCFYLAVSNGIINSSHKFVRIFWKNEEILVNFA